MRGADLHGDVDEYGRARVDELVDLGCGRVYVYIYELEHSHFCGCMC
jgi:hypothetical protein